MCPLPVRYQKNMEHQKISILYLVIKTSMLGWPDKTMDIELNFIFGTSNS